MAAAATARSLGEAIRDARTKAGLTLRDLERVSDGRFKPSAVGGYERGERDISAERLIELSFTLGTTPEELVGDAMRRLFPRTHVEVSIDLGALREQADTKAVRTIGGYAHEIQRRRNDLFGDVITIRAGDLEVIARDAGTDVQEMLEQISSAVRRVGPG